MKVSPTAEAGNSVKILLDKSVYNYKTDDVPYRLIRRTPVFSVC